MSLNRLAQSLNARTGGCSARPDSFGRRIDRTPRSARPGSGGPFALLRACVAGAALCAAVVAAPAAPVRFELSGRVTDDAINGCDTVVVVACGVVTGSYSFDSEATDGNADPLAGLFAASTISFSIDGTEFFSATNGVINVANDFPQDQYGLLATGTAGATGAELSILLQELTGSAFGSDALPLSPLAIAGLLPGGFTLSGADGDGNDIFQLQGSIDSITCTLGCGDGQPVPEPATPLLLALALAACALARRAAPPAARG